MVLCCFSTFQVQKNSFLASNDPESLPKVCYIKRNNSEILSYLRNFEPGEVSGLMSWSWLSFQGPLCAWVDATDVRCQEHDGSLWPKVCCSEPILPRESFPCCSIFLCRHGRYLTVAAVFRGRMSMKVLAFSHYWLCMMFLLGGGRADAWHPE